MTDTPSPVIGSGYSRHTGLLGTCQVCKVKNSGLFCSRQVCRDIAANDLKDVDFYWVCDDCIPFHNGAAHRDEIPPPDNTPAHHGDPINPDYYKKGKFQVIEIIEDQKLPFHLANAVKYILRCKHKDNEKRDLEKAIWYIRRHIDHGIAAPGRTPSES